MYQFSYSEVLADDPSDARDNEGLAFDHAIALIEAAARAPAGAPEGETAVAFVTQLWGLLIEDLAHPGNDLPGELRARLMSVGLWVMAEAQRIQIGQSQDWQTLAEVCRAVRGGLNQGA